MTDPKPISLCIPTYERTDLLFESFQEVIDDDRISEVVIVDDKSSNAVWEELQKHATHPKIKLYRNEINEDCYRNKMTALSYASSDFAILLDSDNVIDKSYIDQLFKFPKWDRYTIYTPDFAYPNFDFRAFSGFLITKENVAKWIDEPMFEVLLNAANYFVNVSEYLKVFDDSIDPVTSDSIYMAYRWLAIHNRIKIVDGMKYFHRVHNGSHYQNNVRRTPNGFHETILNNLRQMR